MKGNPFHNGGSISIGNGPTILAVFIKPSVDFAQCRETMLGEHRWLVNIPQRWKYDFVAGDDRGGCYLCGLTMSRAVDDRAIHAEIVRYLVGSERCLRIWRGSKHFEVFEQFADMSDLDVRLTVLYHIPVNTLHCVYGKLFKTGGSLSCHDENIDECLSV